jgi:hypothetical protein
VSNPGCYATNTQLLLAPLLPFLDQTRPPSVFGVSGYSGAGTKSGEKDDEGRPKTVPKIVSRVKFSRVKFYADSSPTPTSTAPSARTRSPTTFTSARRRRTSAPSWASPTLL